MPWPIKVSLLFIFLGWCIATSPAVAQDITVPEGTPISLVAYSNNGAPDQSGFACGTNFGQTCYGGTLQPNGSIHWTVDGASVSSTYDQVDSTSSACGVDDAGREMDCNSYYDESGYTAVLPAGSHTVVASISTAQDQYAAFTSTWTVLVTPAPIKQTPSLNISCSPNPITFGSQNTTCVASQSGGTGALIWSINGNAWTSTGVNGSAMGFAGWAAGSYTVSVSYSGDNNYNSATASTVLTINPAPSPGPNPQGTIYNFTAKDNSGNSGYAANGNIVAYTDSVTGSWGLVYDNLNRLHTAIASAGSYGNVALTWEYDSFGNRLSQTHTGTPSANVDDAWAHYDLTSNTSPHNRMTSSQGSPAEGSIEYDANGNLTFDGQRRFAYDVENRLCGVYDTALSGNITQYLYNAEGQRVAKGHPATPSTDFPVMPYCSTGGSSFIVDEKYVLGPSGEQITQLDGSDHWQHTNIYAGSQLLATYSQDGNQQLLHFNITDPLGTKRIQTSAAGVKELTCLSLPFGDGPDCDGPEATRHRFTNKERDQESKLDYFGARYYAYNMGRWMSPDWADKPEAVPYSSLDNPQSLNLYGYVLNNPLAKPDLDGHGCPPDCGDPTSPANVAPPTPSLWSRFVDANVSFLHTAAVLYSDLMNPTKNCPNCSIGIVPLGMPEAPGLAAKGVTAYEVGTYGELAPRSVGDGLAIDHIPSNASNIAREEAQLGRPLTAAEMAAVRDQGTAVAVPSDLHQSTSPTFGGRNAPAQIQADAANPQAAAVRDTRAMVNAASAANKQAAQAAAQKICTATGCK